MVPPKSEPSTGKGNFIMRFLRSLLSSKNPHKITPSKLRPRTVVATHQYEHEKEKFAQEEHLEQNWEKEFFERLKRDDRIKKR